MGNNAALFLFLAATSVATFTFVSIVVWVAARTSERKDRDRLALLKAVAESTNENAERVLSYLREEDDRKRARQADEERKGFLIGGTICMAVGVGLWTMLPLFEGPSVLVFLVGAALLTFGLARKQPAAGPTR